MAFDNSSHRWRFPSAVIELENSTRGDRIAYSLWKVLCIRARLRIVFCYRRHPDAGPQLVRLLSEEVVMALEPEHRANLDGETIMVVGSRAEADTFPYGYFKWWLLDRNTGTFRLI